MATHTIRIPLSLSSECSEAACPDAWEECVINDVKSKANRVWDYITVDEANLDRLLQAIANAARIAVDEDGCLDKAQARRWLAWVEGCIRDFTAQGIQLPWASSQIAH